MKRRTIPSRQRGVILFLALIVLVAMLLSGIALFRTVDSGVLMAGNLAMQKSTVSQGDRGIEEAVSWLATASIATLHRDTGAPGYVYTPFYIGDALDSFGAPPHQPSAGQNWLTWWNSYAGAHSPSALPADQNTGFEVKFLIQRLCTANGAPDPTATPPVYCAQTWDTSRLLGGGSKRHDTVSLVGSAADMGGGVYYRIITRIDGPRNTTSFVEAIVSL
ncbi:MAG: hypothetical protein HXY29_07320 [Rhodocyclaceae bacterium]|jgi:hypothetical protein|nr:hypothetical protein [Rhodocyclaceae bacterium]